MQVVANFFYLDEHHDDDQPDNLQLKFQFCKVGTFDHKGFLYN